MDPCPAIDFDAGFNAFLAAAYNLPPGVTVEAKFGAPFDPFQDEATFILCMLSLEELGATSNKVCLTLIHSVNPLQSDATFALRMLEELGATSTMCIK